MRLSDFLRELEEGFNNPGVPDGTGPYRGSAMAAAGRRGPMSGFGRGGCYKKNGKCYDRNNNEIDCKTGELVKNKK